MSAFEDLHNRMSSEAQELDAEAMAHFHPLIKLVIAARASWLKGHATSPKNCLISRELLTFKDHVYFEDGTLLGMTIETTNEPGLIWVGEWVK
jgi:hypothetical protein